MNLKSTESLISVVIVCHIITLNSLVSFDIDFYSRLLIFLSSSCIGFTLIAWSLIFARNSRLKILHNSMIIFSILGYLTKTILLLLDQSLLSVFKNYDHIHIQNYLPKAMSYSALYLLTIFIGINFAIMHLPKTVFIRPNKLKLSFSPSIFFFLLLLVLKVLVYYVLKMGLPGVIPVYEIPLIGGMLVFAVRIGLLFVINIFLFWSVYNKEDKKVVFLAVILTVMNFGIDASVGVKFSLIYQMYLYIIIFIVLEIYKKVSFKQYFLLVVLGTLVIFSYAHLNYYRFGLLRDLGPFESIVFALENKPETSNFAYIFDILERISGIENFLVTLINESNFSKVNSSGLLFDDVAKQYTEVYSGVEGAISASGSTQLSILYLVARENLIMFMCLAVLMFSAILTWFRLCFSKGLNWLGSPIGLSLYQAYLSIFAIYFSFGTGNMIFYIKESLVAGLVIFSYVALCASKFRNA